MYLFFTNGGIIHLEKAVYSEVQEGFLYPKTSRGREIGTWAVSALSGWCYDNEDLSHFHFGGEQTIDLTP